MQLGAVAEPQARLDGFKSRALKAEPPARRHLYVTEWSAAEVPANGEGQAEGATAPAAMLLLGGGTPALGCEERGSSTARLEMLASQRDGGAWSAACQATSTYSEAQMMTCMKAINTLVTSPPPEMKSVKNKYKDVNTAKPVAI